jgi:hypothetical protein
MPREANLNIKFFSSFNHSPTLKLVYTVLDASHASSSHLAIDADFDGPLQQMILVLALRHTSKGQTPVRPACGASDTGLRLICNSPCLVELPSCYISAPPLLPHSAPVVLAAYSGRSCQVRYPSEVELCGRRHVELTAIGVSVFQIIFEAING